MAGLRAAVAAVALGVFLAGALILAGRAGLLPVDEVPLATALNDPYTVLEVPLELARLVASQDPPEEPSPPQPAPAADLAPSLPRVAIAVSDAQDLRDAPRDARPARDEPRDDETATDPSPDGDDADGDTSPDPTNPTDPDSHSDDDPPDDDPPVDGGDTPIDTNRPGKGHGPKVDAVVERVRDNSARTQERIVRKVELAGRTTAHKLEVALRKLAAGPNDRERSHGVRSATRTPRKGVQRGDQREKYSQGWLPAFLRQAAASS